MGRASPIQTSFNAGEWSARAQDRVDIGKRGNAAALLENIIPIIQGPAGNRQGTKYVASVKTPSKKVALIPFEFSTVQAYALEFGDQYVRFYRDRAQIETGPSTPYEISSAYLEAEVNSIAYAQSADVLFLAHTGHKPKKLSRASDTSWTLEDIEFLDGPYMATNATTTTLTPSATSGSVTLTASSTTGINGDTGFQATDVGRLVRLQHGSTWGWGEITARASTTSVTLLVKSTLGGTGAVTDWRLGRWSDTTGYPSSVTFFEDRLFWAGGVEFPQAVHGSRTGDFFNHAPTDTDGTVVDDHAVSLTLSSNQVNSILWLADDEKGLMAGTIGGEWIIRPSDRSEALTPSNVKAARSTTLGSAAVQPVRVDKAVLFAQRGARKLRELAFVFEDDGFRAPDLTVFSQHLTKTGLTRLAVSREPIPVVWAIRTDGKLVGITYDREQDVIGWHPHALGGQSDASGTEPVVESIAVIPTPDGTADELWLSVQRYVDGGTVRYVEHLTEFFDDESTAQEDAFFVDAGINYDGAATTSITGLDHLEGETVSILADGATHPQKTVASGAITLNRSASKVSVGLGYNATIRTLTLEAGASDGTAQGKKQRVNRVIIRVLKTLGMKVGPQLDDLSLPPEMGRSASDNLGEKVPLYSGDIDTPLEGSWYDRGRYYLRQEDPLPMMVTLVMPHVHTENRQ